MSAENIDITEDVELLEFQISDCIEALVKQFGETWSLKRLALMLYALGYRKTATPMEVEDNRDFY